MEVDERELFLALVVRVEVDFESGFAGVVVGVRSSLMISKAQPLQPLFAFALDFRGVGS